MPPEIKAVRGDITTQRVDAIVNAANTTLMGGGGVDGAIHRAAGRQLLEACMELPVLGPGPMRCRVGEAQVTPAFRLPCMYVIHAVGPVYGEHPDPHGALEGAIRWSLKRAVAVGARSVAIPAISCGVYGYPVEDAAHIAVNTVVMDDWDLDEVRFVLYTQETFGAWQRALRFY